MISIWLSLFLILTMLIIIEDFNENVSAGSPPPPDDGIDGLQYIDGDWDVNTTESYTNEIIVLTGNLTVEFGGHLTLRNVTLIMNCSSGGATMDDYYHIEVQKGGTMYILDVDNDNTTTGDASVITQSVPTYADPFYWVWAKDGSNFTMRNSEVYYCGGTSAKFGGGGLTIYTDNATVDRCYISNNYIGIVLYGSDGIISNCTVDWNFWGIMSGYWGNGTIVDNLIIDNEQQGISVRGGSSPPNDEPSNPLIARNKILNSGRGTFPANPIGVTDGCCPVIVNNELINYTEDAIYCGQQCQAIIENNYIDSQGGNYGIVGSSSRNVYVKNCTIVDNTVKEHFFIGDMWFHVTNTTFNQSNVYLEGSSYGPSIDVSWYLHTYVEDTFGTPIPNAKIRIRDSDNGNFDENYTTDANGGVNWVTLMEYNQTKSTITYYTPHHLTVSKDGYETQELDVVMDESKSTVITLQDNESPKLNHTPITSAMVNEPINITVNVSDNIEVGNGTLYYQNVGDTSYTSVNMTLISGNNQTGNWSAIIPAQSKTDVVHYYIWANDTTGNNATLPLVGDYSIEILDDAKPEIIHTPVTSANVNEIILIEATVTDDVEVSQVKLNYTDVHGENYNVTMTYQNGNWSYVIPQQDTIGEIAYYIWAMDNSGNHNKTPLYSIQINDVTPPTIFHTPITSIDIRKSINITAIVIDDVGVDEVYLNFTSANGENHNVSMNVDESRWYYEIEGQNVSGTVGYFIWAEDTSWNGVKSNYYSISVIGDTVSPTILLVTPIGNNISISANISIVFSEAMNQSFVENAITISPDIAFSNLWMNNQTLILFFTGNLTYNTTFTVTIDIGAKDIAGNNLASVYSWEFTTETELVPDANGTTNDYLWIVIILIVVVVSLCLWLFYQTIKGKKEPEE